MEKVEWRARKLRAARALAKLSQKGLADDAGVNIKAIVGVENGTTRPRLDTWDKILASLARHGVRNSASGLGVEFDPDVIDVPENLDQP